MGTLGGSPSRVCSVLCWVIQPAQGQGTGQGSSAHWWRGGRNSQKPTSETLLSSPHKYLQPMLTHQQVLAVWCWLLRYKEAFFGDMLSTAVCEPRGNSMKWMLPTRKNSSTSRLKSHSSHSKTECNFQPCFLTCTDQRSIHAVLTLNQFLPIPWHQLATV